MNTRAKCARRPGRPKSEQKAEAIREAAGQLFLNEGMSRTSMDAIAQAAGVSKQTVYSHFRSKDDLFRSCVCGKVEDYGLHDCEPAADESLEQALERVGLQYLTLICDEEVVAMFRLMVSEANAFPNVVRNFHEDGPVATHAAVATLLARPAGACCDPATAERAAADFLALVRAEYFPELLLGIRNGIPDDEMRQHVADCVRKLRTLYPAIEPGG